MPSPFKMRLPIRLALPVKANSRSPRGTTMLPSATRAIPPGLADGSRGRVVPQKVGERSLDFCCCCSAWKLPLVARRLFAGERGDARTEVVNKRPKWAASDQPAAERPSELTGPLDRFPGARAGSSNLHSFFQPFFSRFPTFRKELCVDAAPAHLCVFLSLFFAACTARKCCGCHQV